MWPCERWLLPRKEPVESSGFGERAILKPLCGLFRRGDSLRDAVDGLDFCVAPGAVAVDQNGKSDDLAACPGQIAAQRICFVQRAGLGPQMALERGVLEAV